MALLLSSSSVLAPIRADASDPSAGAAPCEPGALDGAALEPSPSRGLVAAALGLDRLTDGDAPGAIACLQLAARHLPGSAVVARDLASAHLHAGELEAALASIDAAILLGDADPDARTLRAVILARLGRTTEAATEARAAAGWRGELVAASLGDGRAAYRASELGAEATPRGALASVVLAAHAVERGDGITAGLLLGDAEGLVSRDADGDIAAAVRAVSGALDALDALTLHTRLRASIEHATNPALLSAPPPVDQSGLRLAILAEGEASFPIGRARVGASLRADKQAYLTEREAFRDLDLFGLTLTAGAELPIGRHPYAARVGLGARFTDTFGHRLDVHYATSIEGGPSLVLPMSPALSVSLAFLGIATDFVDRSPPDARISSQNRDLFGQRAVFGLTFATEWLDGRAEAMFLRDDALGDAFDALGGALAIRVLARPSPGVSLSTGAGVLIRDYGPVGDRALIGPAATRAQLRTALELGAQIELTTGFSFVVEDVWIQNNARELHSYTENVLSIGVEQVW